MWATAILALKPRPLWAGPPVPLGADFGRNSETRRASLSMGAAATAAQLGGGHLEVDSQVTLRAAGRSHAQADRTVLTWDDARGMSMRQLCGEVPLEVWRLGEALFVRYNRGQIRQKSSRDMDADALFNQALGSFAQALTWLSPLVYADPQPQEYARAPAWRYSLEVAPAGAADASRPPTADEPAAIIAAPAAGGARPALWRQTLAARQATGFVVVDQNTGILMHGELDASAELTHPNAPTTRVTLRLRHQLKRRPKEPALTAPPAVPEFRRQLRDRDPIAFYRASLAPPAAPRQPQPKRKKGGSDDGEADDGSEVDDSEGRDGGAGTAPSP